MTGWQCLCRASRAGRYFLADRERLTTGRDLLMVSLPWAFSRTFIALLTSATFRTPVVLPPLPPAVQ